MSIKDNYRVISIPKEQTYDWLLNKHYGKRIPSISYSFGLFDDNNILQGVCTFGYPMASQLQSACGSYPVIELNRLVINEIMIANILSFFVSSSIKLLPENMVIVSYADEGQGHTGYIYQATNWIYTGMGSGGWGWAVKGLEHMHHTSIEDSVGRYENRNTDISLENLLKAKYGDKLYKKQESKKHRYFYFHGNKTIKKDMKNKLKYTILPYPKGDNKRYDASYQPATQGLLF